VPPAWRAQLDPVLVASYITSGARIVRRRATGHRRFVGDAAAICRAVVDACWTGHHLAASGGHFRQFWTRDLGFSAAALVELGQRERVVASLAWALDAWRRGRHVTTTVFPGGRPRDVWTYGVDSLPMLIWSLRVASADELVTLHGSWLAAEVARYGELVVDARTGLVRDDQVFSTHRDTVRTRSNAYANAMALLLDRLCRETGWFRSPVPAGADARFVERFWRGDRFIDRPGRDEVTGDATVVPFVFGVVPDALGLRAALRAAEEVGLADPIPLRYSNRRRPALEDPVQRRLVPDYQGTSIWTSLGGWYLQLLRRVDPVAARSVAATYRSVIERAGTVWEVYDGRARGARDLRPYRGTAGLFVSDEAMLWAAVLLTALESASAPST
jgi:hypothetical protein